MADALSKSGSNRSAVRAVCLAVSGVNHPTDEQKILNWLRYHLFSCTVVQSFTIRYLLRTLASQNQVCKEKFLHFEIYILYIMTNCLF